jgi:hypothetical protein
VWAIVFDDQTSRRLVSLSKAERQSHKPHAWSFRLMSIERAKDKAREFAKTINPLECCRWRAAQTG